ncbi:hypothetical protein Bpro_1048 [Polaromonas sp. JS666]|nr:hypothetical protein Bpro_1048 [Polaromonas sp. JS666]
MPTWSNLYIQVNPNFKEVTENATGKCTVFGISPMKLVQFHLVLRVMRCLYRYSMLTEKAEQIRGQLDLWIPATMFCARDARISRIDEAGRPV